MAKIKMTDMKLTEESLEQVKGGPAYIKIGDIKGESTDATNRSGHKKWSDIMSVNFTRSSR